MTPRHKYKYSHSALSRAECPFSFKKHYIDKDRPEQLDDDDFSHPVYGLGSAFHYMAETYAKHLVKEGLQTDLSIKEDLFNEQFDTERISISRYEELRKMWFRFVENFVLDLESLYDVECNIAIDIDGKERGWDDDDVFFRGKIDRLHVSQQIATVVDYKTNRFLPSESDFATTQPSLVNQLNEYAWLASLMLDHEDIELYRAELHFVRYGSAIRAIEITRDEIGWIQKDILAKIERIENFKRFRAIPGYNCNYCEYLETSCPAAKRARELKGILTPQTASAVARDLATQDPLIKKKRAALKKWVEKHGSVHTGNAVFEINEKRGTKVNADMALQFLEAQGIEVEGMFTVTDAAAKKALDEDVYNALVKFAGSENISTKFEFNRTE